MTEALASEVLSGWGHGALVRLVAARENTVYEAVLASGQRVALRLHRPGYRSAEAIAAELRWAEGLAARGIAIPPPVRTLSGAYLTNTTDGRLASVVGWVEGRPFAPSPDRMRVLGAEIARFHAAADEIGGKPDGPSTAAFRRWDASALLGESPTWGRFWENPTLSPAEALLLCDVRRTLRDVFATGPSQDIGLIHADLLPDNVLDTGTRLVLIDFDDCGVGYRAYDLATALIAHVDRADFAALRHSLIAGYDTERGPGSGVAGHVELFTLVRALASCGWAASRTEASDPRCRAYAERAVRLAERWCARA